MSLVVRSGSVICLSDQHALLQCPSCHLFHVHADLHRQDGGGKTSPFAGKKGAANSVAGWPSLGEDRGLCSGYVLFGTKGRNP